MLSISISASLLIADSIPWSVYAPSETSGIKVVYDSSFIPWKFNKISFTHYSSGIRNAPVCKAHSLDD